MRARLRWRLLLVPRFFLALGVLVWALLAVLLRRERRPARPVRLPSTSDDPVGEVLAVARPESRCAGEKLDVEDLRWIVSVDELELVAEGGCNTVVSLDDTVSSYAEVFSDGLADALADQPGIEAVDHADREVILVRSLLSLPDVQAAAIRALLAVNRHPQTPRERPLEPAVMNALVESVAGLMARHGFTGRLRTTREKDLFRLDFDDRRGPGFYRLFPRDRLVQLLELRDATGHHRDDGTITDAYLVFAVEVVELPAAAPGGVVSAERILWSHELVPATADGIENHLVSKALPLCQSTTSREAIVERWVGGLPGFVPDRVRTEAAEIAARWGFPKHAWDLGRR